jgi:hypothetical protein
LRIKVIDAAMQLSEYLRATNTTYTKMAAAIGAGSVAVVWRHATGDRHPTPDFIERYEKATLGAVKAQDWQELARSKAAEADEGAAA